MWLFSGYPPMICSPLLAKQYFHCQWWPAFTDWRNTWSPLTENGNLPQKIQPKFGSLKQKFLDPPLISWLSPQFERMEQSSLAYILDLQIAVVVRYIYIFTFCRYAFRLKVGYFFLSKGAKFPGIFSSSTKTTELTQSRYRASLFPSLFSGDSLYYWRHFIRLQNSQFFPQNQ